MSDVWLAGAGVLLAFVALPAWVAARRPVEDGLAALEVAGGSVALALLLFAEGVGRSSLSDLGLIMGVASVIGSLAFATLLEREP
jgi:multisubunit Na+/H+ antiporter MnhF subunit